jgi:hypothetical protein
VAAQPAQTALDTLERNVGERELRFASAPISQRQAGKAFADEEVQEVLGRPAVGTAEREDCGERSSPVGHS